MLTGMEQHFCYACLNEGATNRGCFNELGASAHNGKYLHVMAARRRADSNYIIRVGEYAM
jgi:hypothetical protein